MPSGKGRPGNGSRSQPGRRKPGGPAKQPAPGRAGPPSGAAKSGTPPAKQHTPPPPSAAELAETAARLDQTEVAKLGDGAPTPALPEPLAEPTAEALRTAVAQATRATQLADIRAKELETKTAETTASGEARLQELAEERTRLHEEIASQRTQFDRQAAELAAEQKELAAATATSAETSQWLLDKEGELRDLEQEAISAFATYRADRLSHLQTELADARARAETERQQREADETARRQQAQADLDRARAELSKLEGELTAQQLVLDRKERTFQARWDHLDEEVAIRLAETGQRQAGELGMLQADLASQTERADTFRELADQRKAELDRYEMATVETGHRTLPEIAAELAEVKRHNAELRQELADRPAQMQDRLLELEASCQTLAAEKRELIRRVAEMQRSADAGAISVAERQNAIETARAYQRLNTVLQQETEYLNAKLTGLQTGPNQLPPFPACSVMDDNEDYREAPQLTSGMPRLPVFVKRVRDLIADREGLYYSERDLRSFLGGLACSKLHLLEGISGIGKTRLPQAFAAAVGATCQTVAVAAEWRSPSDLMGYYNSFERKFYESDFTQALYRAQLPLFAGKPFFVVLDEMNLSHPEQYFNDLLSELENVKGPQRVRLMTAPVEPSPELLIDGMYLALPENMWFLGTANNDETTVRFADKTYDRSYVLELPPKPVPHAPGEPEPMTPISLAALDRRFGEAMADFPEDCGEVLRFYEDKLGDMLRLDMRVSWGRRLERQAERYVPVVRAAGGSIGEAADHLLATKVLRKLKGRVEIKPSKLEALGDLLRARWPQLCDKTEPVESTRVLAEEVASRGTLL